MAPVLFFVPFPIVAHLTELKPASVNVTNVGAGLALERAKVAGEKLCHHEWVKEPGDEVVNSFL